jgi:hypothetical protein
MTITYDPHKILAEANEWREKAAAAVDPAYRDECLQCAARAEDLVKRSFRTLSIKEAEQIERPLKQNAHCMLGQTNPIAGQLLSMVPLYEQSAFRHIHEKFGRLLDSDPEEEVIQQFIQEIPVILHQFPALLMSFKTPILTRYRADFAIVTAQKELILIEIENTRTRLLKKDGAIAAPLSHAFDQVESWLHVVNDHKLAILDTLNVDRDMVSTVRGVVIAGRDKGQDAAHLKRLKGTDRGRVSFLTFDDLLFSVGALARDIGNL